MSPCRSSRKFNLFNAVLFASLLGITVTLLPWYAVSVGISRAEWLLFFFYVAATGLSITVGYHRLFAHRSFRTGPVITFLNLFFGAAALEESALHWASLHRDHHRYVDTPQDPYNIKQGFWHAHIGWMLFWRNLPDYRNVKDLHANPLIRNQHRYYPIWVALSGIGLPLAIGAATGHLLGAFLLAVVGRITLVHHSTWSINSICHTFGKATYDIDASARDHWGVALLTNGEGYHNFHHRFCGDYRNGVRWYQWDPSKWVIALLNRLGLAGNLQRTSPQRILSARTAAEYQRVERAVRRSGREKIFLLGQIRGHYEALRTILEEWEKLERGYQRIRQTVSKESRSTVRSLKRSLAEQHRAFVNARRAWISILTRTSAFLGEA